MSKFDRDKYLCEDYKKGVGINELSRTYEITIRRVGQILIKNRIPRRPRHHKDRGTPIHL